MSRKELLIFVLQLFLLIIMEIFLPLDQYISHIGHHLVWSLYTYTVKCFGFLKHKLHEKQLHFIYSHLLPTLDGLLPISCPIQPKSTDNTRYMYETLDGWYYNFSCRPF